MLLSADYRVCSQFNPSFFKHIDLLIVAFVGDQVMVLDLALLKIKVVIEFVVILTGKGYKLLTQISIRMLWFLTVVDIAIVEDISNLFWVELDAIEGVIFSFHWSNEYITCLFSSTCRGCPVEWVETRIAFRLESLRAYSLILLVIDSSFCFSFDLIELMNTGWIPRSICLHFLT